MGRDVVADLGDVLRSAGFDEESRARLVGEVGVVPPVEALDAVGRSGDGRLATLLDLFIGSRALERRVVRVALAPLDLEDLERARLLEIREDTVRASVSLALHDGLIVAGDSGPARSVSDSVQSVTGSAQALAALTVREPVTAALDLGTGSGIQALLAARHAERVVGVDVNPRALAFAGLGQRLNRIANVEWREGSWLAPVAGERFDQIVCNPPFVISPERSYLFRDSEEGGETLCRRLVRASVEHLTDGGCATLMVNWAHGGDDWSAPLREWIRGLPCDAVLLRYISQDPLTYALHWNRQLETADSRAFEATVTRWVDHYRRQGIDRLDTGAIALRRSSATGTPWVRTFEPQRPPTGAGGGQLHRIFTAGDIREQARGTQALLGLAWRLAEGNRLEQTLPFVEGSYVAQAGSLFFEDGIGLGTYVDPRALAVLFALDGQTPFSELVQATPVPDGLDETGYASLCAATFEELLERGFLVPADA
jgi:methylase of polypeptide subunit release factors